MKNILFNFYCGNINPSEDTYPEGEEYQKAANQVYSIETALLSQLDERGQELYR